MSERRVAERRVHVSTSYEDLTASPMRRRGPDRRKDITDAPNAPVYPQRYVEEINRLRAVLRWIHAEAHVTLDVFPGTLAECKQSLREICDTARVAIAEVPGLRFDPFAAIAADTNVDPAFRRILAGQPLSAYGREDHDMTTFGTPLKQGT